jgi:hypothetical protein
LDLLPGISICALKTAIMFFMRKLTHPDCCENILQLINEGNKPRVVDVDSRIISRARSKLGGFARSLTQLDSSPSLAVSKEEVRDVLAKVQLI